MLIVDREQVQRLLPMQACIELMADALRALGRGDAVNPLRQALRIGELSAILGVMPGYLGQPRVLGMKNVAIFAANEGTEHDSHQGLVQLFDTTHGTPLAIIDASSVTAIRTAATSAVATRLLAREQAGDLAILGSGVQATTHLEAMRLVRPIRRVRIFSPSAAHRDAFAEREARRHELRVEAVGSARAAVEGADLICTTTSAREPILNGAWLSPGVHVNAVGSSIATTRELDTAAVTRSRLFVDRRESTLNEAGDFLFPKKEGAIDDDHIVGEIGEILLGRIKGRTAPDELTLFKSLGLAVEDLAAAHHVYTRALEEGIGTEVPWS